MAFATQEKRQLVRIISIPVDTAGNFNSRWAYTTPDSVATVTAANYFLPAQDVLKVGDVIDIVCGFGGSPDRIAVLVTVSNTTTLTIAINTDASGA
jgi:hypothetical protein